MLIAATALIATLRAIAFLPIGGDISVWITLHELWARGNTLYVDVWDHKDFGFLMFYHFFYLLADVLGIYLGALLAVLIYWIGCYLIIRTISTKFVSVFFACLISIFFVMSPTYLGVYVEPLAVAFSVLALGLLNRWPALAGVMFAVAISIKLSLFVLWIGLVILLAYYSKKVTLLRDRSTIELRKFIIGTICGGCIFLLMVLQQGILSSWYSVTMFNAEYARFRSAGVNVPAYLVGSAIHPDFYWRFILIVGASFFMSLAICNFLCRNIDQSDIVVRTSAVTSTFAFLAPLVLILQTPIAYQHFQFAVGFLLLAIGLKLSIVIEFISKSFNWSPKLLNSLPLVLLAVLLTIIQNLNLMTLQNWKLLNKPGEMSLTLSKLPKNTTFMLLGGNSNSIDFRAMRKDVTLACKYIYYFPHMEKSFGSEILNCLNAHPDFVVLQNSRWYLDENVEAMLRQITSDNYTECTDLNYAYGIWSINRSDCAYLKGT